MNTYPPSATWSVSSDSPELHWSFRLLLGLANLGLTMGLVYLIAPPIYFDYHGNMFFCWPRFAYFFAVLCGVIFIVHPVFDFRPLFSANSTFVVIILCLIAYKINPEVKYVTQEMIHRLENTFGLLAVFYFIFTSAQTYLEVKIEESLSENEKSFWGFLYLFFCKIIHFLVKAVMGETRENKKLASIILFFVGLVSSLPFVLSLLIKHCQSGDFGHQATKIMNFAYQLSLTNQTVMFIFLLGSLGHLFMSWKIFSHFKSFRKEMSFGESVFSLIAILVFVLLSVWQFAGVISFIG